MQQSLAGRQALVSGATSGIGAAIARRLVRDGARVVALGRRADRLAALRDELGDACHAAAVDVGDIAAVRAALDALPAGVAAIDLLVNNAGTARGQHRAQDADRADWQAMVDANIGGVLNLTHALLPGMVARDFGDIFNIGSIAAGAAYPTGNVYGATKAFVRQFTRNLRADLLGRNVRATCIEPGTVRTEFAAVRTGSAEAAAKFYDHPNLMEAEDVAEIVALCLALPRRINVNLLEAMPLGQAHGGPVFADGMAVVPGA